MADSPTTLETAGTTGTPTSDPIDALDLSASDIWENDTSPVTSEIVHVTDRKAEPAEEIEEVEPIEGETQAQRDERGRFAAKQKAEQEGPPEQPVTRPFQYRAMGETRALETWKEDGEGNVTVPATEVGELRAALNARHLVEGQYAPLIERYKGENAQLRQHVQQIQSQRSEHDVRAQALVSSLMQMAQMDDEVQSLEQFYQFRQKLPELLLRAENAHLKTRATTATTRPETARPEPVDTPYALPAPQEAVATTLEYVEHTKLDGSFRDVTADDWKQYESRISRSPLAFIRPATAEEAQEYGVRAGQPVFDRDAYHADVTEYVTTLRRAREIASKQSEVAATNARLTQRTITAPPSVRGAASPSKEPGRPQFKSKQDVDRWFESDEL